MSAWHWVVDVFEASFMRQALLAGALTAVAAALVGTWVVARRMTFAGEAMSHAVLPGVSLAVLWGVDVTIGALVSALVMAGGIAVVRRRTSLPEDAVIGLLFVGMLAAGVAIVSRSPSYSQDLASILFGDVLAIDGGDLALLAVTLVVVAVTLVVFHRSLLVSTLDARRAQVLGLRPGLTANVLSVLVALVVVAALRSVGALLVVALLVGPPATASLVARRFVTVAALGAALGVASVGIGLVASYRFDLAAGAAIAAATVAVFLLTLVGREVAGAR